MLIAFLALLAAPAQPASPPGTPTAAVPPAPVDPARLTEAIRLLDAEDFEGDAIHSAEMTLELLLAAMTEQIQSNSDEPLPEDFLDKLRQTMRDHSTSTLRTNMPSMKREAGEIYAREFTVEELIRLRELSADPVMVKARKRNKVIAPKLMMIGARTMREAQQELEVKIQRLVTDYLGSLKQDSPDRS